MLLHYRADGGDVQPDRVVLLLYWRSDGVMYLTGLGCCYIAGAMEVCTTGQGWVVATLQERWR